MCGFYLTARAMLLNFLKVIYMIELNIRRAQIWTDSSNVEEIDPDIVLCDDIVPLLKLNKYPKACSNGPVVFHD